MTSTHDRILDAAHAIFSAKGFRGATTREIAAEAGVNEVTIFRRFSTKEALLAAAVERAAGTTIDRLRESALPAEPRDLPRELRSRMLTVFRAFMLSAPHVRTALAEWGHHPGIDDRRMATARYLHDEILSYMTAAAADGHIRRTITPEAATAMVVAPLFAHGMLHTMIPRVFDASPEEAVDAYLDIILGGLLPSPHTGGPA